MTAEEKYPLLIGHSLAGRTRLRNIYEVANFICVHGQCGDLTITQKDGTPFLDTFGIYINKIADMDYREELLKVLIPMQMELDGTKDNDDYQKTETEMTEMKEYERLHRQAEHYKKLYPKGTRILLQHMGDDPRPIDDNMRGTVSCVDDIGTVHCNFDNGRSLGIVPGEDSFRKLTAEELAEEQENEIDEDNGPVMGM